MDWSPSGMSSIFSNSIFISPIVFYVVCIRCVLDFVLRLFCPTCAVLTTILLHLFSTVSSASIQWEPFLKPLSTQANLGAAAVGSVVDVDLASSGLRSDHVLPPSTLYVRTACVSLWNHLETTSHRVSFVTGCPGVGTSVVVFAYAMWLATVHNKRVFYVHSHGESYSLIATAGAGSSDVRCGHIADFLDQPQVLF